MQFRVVIPEHVKAGQTIRIHCPDGTEANVKVPKGLQTGDSFIFEMSVDQLNNPQALLDSLKDNSTATNNANASSKKKKNTTATNNYSPKPKKGFLDREIVNLQDFCLALTVGLMIGLGIVLGFLGGILYVTKDVAQIPSPVQQPPPQLQKQQLLQVSKQPSLSSPPSTMKIRPKHLN
jgi:hypothetical protein